MQINSHPLSKPEIERIQAWLRQPESILFRKVIAGLAEIEEENARKKLEEWNSSSIADYIMDAKNHHTMAANYKLLLHVMDEASTGGNNEPFPYALNEIISDCDLVSVVAQLENQ